MFTQERKKTKDGVESWGLCCDVDVYVYVHVWMCVWGLCMSTCVSLDRYLRSVVNVSYYVIMGM